MNASERTLHFRVDVPGSDRPHTAKEKKASADVAKRRVLELLASRRVVVHEWRIVADAGPGFPTYEFTWRDEDSAVAEAGARAFLEGPGASKSLSNPVLMHRTVTTTPWKTAGA